MEGILLSLEDPDERSRLQAWLASGYEVRLAGAGEAEMAPFDLAIVDVPGLARWKEFLQYRKQREKPVALPVLAVAGVHEEQAVAPELGDMVDDVIGSPVKRPELQNRVRNLLGLRRLSRQVREDGQTLQGREVLGCASEDWELIFDAAPDLIAILDRDHQIVKANRAMAAALKMEPGEMVGRPCYEVVHRLPSPPDICPHSQLLQNGRQHVAEIKMLDRDFLVTASPLRDREGRPLGSVHVARDITESKRTWEALRRQAELLDLAHDAILVRDLQGHIVFWNHGAEEIYGWTRQEAMGQNYQELLKTEFLQPLEEIETQLLRDMRWEGELVHTTREGHRVVVAGRWALHKGEPGNPARILEIDTDITQRKVAEVALHRAYDDLEARVEERTADLQQVVAQLQVEVEQRLQTEEALRESEERFARFMRFLPGTALMRDTRGRYVFANETWEKLSGKKQPQWLGKSLEDVWPSQFAAQSRELDQQVIASREPLEMIQKLPSLQGERYFLATRFPILDQAGKPVLVGIIGIDITARQQAEEALRESEERFRVLFETVGNVIIVTSSEGRILEFNREAERLSGYERQQVLGQTTWELFVPEELKEAAAAIIARVASGEVIRNLEFPVQLQNGNTHYFLWNINPLPGKGGKVGRIIISGQDITRRSLAEEALKVSEQKLRVLTSQLLTIQERERSRLSRELHDGLGQALLVFKLQLRAIQRNLPEGQEDLKSDCDRTLKYIDEIITDIRRLSRDLSPTVLEDIGLAAAIKALCEEFTRLQGVECTLNLESLPTGLSKEAQINIYRIYQEVLANISKYAAATRVEVNVAREEAGLAFAIADNGVGFDVEAALSRSPIQKGLGLAAIDERVRMLGGHLEIISQEGQGTQIKFVIPQESQGLGRSG